MLERIKDIECPVCGSPIALSFAAEDGKPIRCVGGHMFSLDEAERIEIVYRATPSYGKNESEGGRKAAIGS